jgi:hypothetical protein
MSKERCLKSIWMGSGGGGKVFGCISLKLEEWSGLGKEIRVHQL